MINPPMLFQPPPMQQVQFYRESKKPFGVKKDGDRNVRRIADNNSSLLPVVQDFDRNMHSLIFEVESKRDNSTSTGAEELEVDYSYMDRAFAAATNAPDMEIDDDDFEAYAGLSDFYYTIEDDY